MQVSIYRWASRLIAFIHLIIMSINFISIPMVIIYEPFWIWMPIITFMVSPVIGGTYCMFNRLENHFRKKALMPLIEDRLGDLFNRRK